MFPKILNDVAPIKEIRLKNRTETWMTSEMLELIQLRDETLYMFRKHSTDQHRKEFNYYMTKVQNCIKSARRNFFANKVEENEFDSKCLWSCLNNLAINRR